MERQELNYREYGSGEPIVILHGLLGMLDNWHSFASTLGQHYHVLVPDQRNHGKSFHSSDFNYSLLAEDLKTFCEHLGLENPHLMGHSMGGKAMLQFLEKYPDHSGKAICIDMPPGASQGGHEPIFKALLALEPATLSSRNDAVDFLMKKLKSKAIVHFLLKNLDRKRGNGYAWKANIRSLWENYDEILKPVDREKAYEGDILFIRGGASGYIGEEDMKRIREDYPQAEIKTIPGAGHWVHAEAPDALLDMVLAFLRKK